MQTETEWQAAEHFLGGPPQADLTDHIFLWVMTKAARGDDRDLQRHRQGDVLTDQAMLRMLMKYGPQVIRDLASLCELIEYTQSDDYRMAVVRMNGWLH